MYIFVQMSYFVQFQWVIQHTRAVTYTLREQTHYFLLFRYVCVKIFCNNAYQDQMILQELLLCYLRTQLKRIRSVEHNGRHGNIAPFTYEPIDVI